MITLGDLMGVHSYLEANGYCAGVSVIKINLLSHYDAHIYP